MSRTGPFIPVFRPGKRRGQVLVGTAIGEPPPVHGTASPGAIAVSVAMPAATAVAGPPCGIDAILSFNPITYHTLAGASADARTDWGYAGMTLAVAGSNLSFATIAGDDGCFYPGFNVGGTGALDGSDHSDLTPSNVGGLTAGILMRNDSAAGTQTVAFGKITDSGDLREWSIGTGGSEADEAKAFLWGGGTNQFTRYRETNTDPLVTDTWVLVIARFGATTTSTPDLRVNGTNITGTTVATGTGLGDTTAPLLIGYRGVTSGRYNGALAHAFTIAGVLSDGDCQTIEDGFRDHGWGI